VELGRTKAVDDTMEPEWDPATHNSVFEMKMGATGTIPSLTVEVYDMDIGGPGDFLGQVVIKGKELLSPPQGSLKELGYMNSKFRSKTEWGGKVYKLGKKAGRNAKYNRMVQGEIMIAFDPTMMESARKLHHDSVKLRRLAEAQKGAMVSALKHSLRLAKKHMKASLEAVEGNGGRNNRPLWVLYCAHRKEYTRAKVNLKFYQNVKQDHFYDPNAIDPEKRAEREKELEKRRAEELRRMGGKKQKRGGGGMTMEDKIRLAGENAGLVSGPGGEVSERAEASRGEQRRAKSR